MPKKKTPARMSQQFVPAQLIERRIYLIRDRQVMLDSDLAELYEVETRALIQAVKRNLDRFPEDFTFQLTKDEAAIMRAFVRLRELMATNEAIARKLDELEKKYDAKFKQHDIQFKAVFEVIRKMLKPPKKARRLIGFTTDN